MSHNRIVWSGLDELRAGLRALPAELAHQAAGVVEGSADTAAHDIVAAYPEKSGNLRKGVRVTKARGQFSTAAVVQSRARHAGLFEAGTATRHNALGSNQVAMPPGRVFVPIVIRVRRRMEGELMGIVRQQAGFQWTEHR